MFNPKDSSSIPIMLKEPISENQSETLNYPTLEARLSEWIVNSNPHIYYNGPKIILGRD